MNKATKAAMMSLFIYPGVGQFFLKKYISSSVFITLFSIPFFWTLFDVFEKTNLLMKNIVENHLPLDVATLTDVFSNLVSEQTQTLDNKALLMMIIWLLSTVDAYRAAYYQKD